MDNLSSAGQRSFWYLETNVPKLGKGKIIVIFNIFIVLLGRKSRENTREEIRRWKRGRKKRKRLQRNLKKEKTLASGLQIEKARLEKQ